MNDKNSLNSIVSGITLGIVLMLGIFQFTGVQNKENHIINSSVPNPFFSQLSVVDSFVAEAVSTDKSTISPKEIVVKNRDEIVTVTVNLKNHDGLPVKGHRIELISSGSHDSIQGLNPISDENGSAVFSVKSDQPGKVIYSAFDLTTNQKLSEKSTIVYLNEYVNLFSNSDIKLSNSSVGNSSSSAEKLVFEDVPGSIQPGETISFTLAAKDQLDQVVTSYNGKVRFTSESTQSSNVNLPADYQFTVDDLGRHTFSLALLFNSVGEYKISAVDLNNSAIKGEIVFNVTNNQLSDLANGQLLISSPISGTYSNNIQVVSGKAKAGSVIAIFDNSVKIGTAVADVNGNFSYTTSSLTDGEHVFSIGLMNEVGTIIETSEKVTIKIDTSAPEIEKLEILPSKNVGPSKPITIKLFTNEVLLKSSVLVDSTLYELQKNETGVYETSLVSPGVNGQYPVTVIIVDELGNESKIDDLNSIIVGPAENISVPSVSGLKVTPSENRITLSWDKPVDSSMVKNYRVYYGNSPNELTEAVDTFTDSTTWYVPNLENGKEYYFAVVAIDENGNSSEIFSNIESGTPNPSVVFVDTNVEIGVKGQEVIPEMETDVSETGPDVIYLLLLSALGGYLFKNRFRRI